MTIPQTQTTQSPGATEPSPASASRQSKPRRRQMSFAQRLVLTAAALPLAGIVLVTIAGALGLIGIGQMVDVALTLGEEPGMFVFAAMLWCTPVQWLVRRTQVPVRKMLGILFGGYAIANFVMFVIEDGLAASLSRPFLIAGTIAMLLSIPLLVTSGRWAQRRIGMKNWRKLHKLTYVIAFALVLHVAFIGEIGLSGMLILAALFTRIPPVAEAIGKLGQMLREDAPQTANQHGALGQKA